MQTPTTKLLRLLSADHPAEVRRATALVMGELGLRDGEAAEALCNALQDADSAVRLEVIRAVGKLRIESALPQLLSRIKDGGAEADSAAHAAAHLGAKGTRALQELMPKVAPGLRRYIAAALAGGGTASATAAAAAVLLDKDPGVVEAAVRSLAEQIPTLAPAQRQAWTDQLLELAGDRRGGVTPPLPAATQTAVVRLLAALDDPRAGAALWDKVLPPHAPEVRAAALQGVGKWAASPTKDQLKRLFAAAADADFRIAAPALVILQRLPADNRAAAEWRMLLRAPDVAVRRLALDKIGDHDDDETAAALLEQLRHADRSLRDAALARLAKLEHGRKALTTALLEADAPDHAWLLARAQAPFAAKYPAGWREEVFDQAGKHLEASDRRADPLLFLLRETDPADLRDRLEQRALALRKKKAYPTALLYLRLLARDPACGFPIRLELAACGLKVSGKDLASESRAADPSLGQFATLCQQDEAELARQVGQIKWLDTEDLYYLGFDLVEHEGRAKKAGGEILKLAAKRSPRTKVGQAAKRKLASAGLD
ncbi:MAG TPA: HEAT repeat domain-containing protein [Gemmataceae bacterium]|nr:HEAT repeat domain-containing protein [Gemmataceae bacterium]